MRRPLIRSARIVLSLLAGIACPAGGALAATPAPPAAAPGSIGVQLVDAPTDSHAPGDHSYIIGRPAPGTTVRRQVEIINATASTATVAVYPAAASLHRGVFGFAAGRDRNELAGWTSVSRSVLHLRAGTHALETVTIRVPRRAPPGGRYGVVWAEVSGSARGTGGVRVVNRVGIRMYISVGGSGAARSNFAIGEPTASRSASGQPVVLATVGNSGTTRLEIAGTLTLSDGPGGLRAGPFPAALRTPLGAGELRLITVRLDRRVPSGSWNVELRLGSGSLQRVARATITLAPALGAAPGSIAPTVAGLVLLTLGAAAALGLVVSRLAARRSPGL